MRRRRLFVLLLLLITGCAHLASQEEKEASFKPYVNVRIGRVPLRDFIEARTGVLVAGAQPLEVVTDKDQLAVKLKPTDAHGAVDVGSAAAVSADGYFLTAAHCIKRSPIFLVIQTLAGPQAYPARVVWRPPDSAPDCDLALLKIHALPAAAFEVAPNSDLLPSDVVITSGANGEAAGRLISITPADSLPYGVLPPTWTLIHDVPLTHGDSGGPLILLDGRLIGIEILVRGSYLSASQSVAIEPDPDWLNRIITQDRTHP